MEIEILKKRIEELEACIYAIDMLDHWSQTSEALWDKYNKELVEAKDLLMQEVLK